MAQCYFPDASVASNYSPCDSGAQESHCCSDGHYCYSNGLCFDEQKMTAYRGGCTDKSWNSAACSDLCLEYSTYSGVWPCGNSGSWACNPPECGNSSLMFTMPAGKIMRNAALSSDIALSSTGSAAATITVTQTTTGPSSGQATGTNNTSSGVYLTGENCSTRTGALAGIGVGLGLPLLLALLAIIAMVRDRKKAKEFQAVPSGPDTGPDMATNGFAPSTAGASFYAPKWMANQQGGSPSPSANLLSLSSHNASAYPSELPSNEPGAQGELESTSGGSRP